MMDRYQLVLLILVASMRSCARFCDARLERTWVEFSTARRNGVGSHGEAKPQRRGLHSLVGALNQLKIRRVGCSCIALVSASTDRVPAAMGWDDFRPLLPVAVSFAALRVIDSHSPRLMSSVLSDSDISATFRGCAANVSSRGPRYAYGAVCGVGHTTVGLQIIDILRRP